jgi:Pentapeptide repeats (8 copies)
MVPQIRRITRPATRGSRATLTLFLLAACWGGLLCRAVSAPATVWENGASLNGVRLNGQSLNGTSFNGQRLNGVSLNGENLNGLSLNGVSFNGANLNGLAPHATTRQRAPLPAGPPEPFPFYGVSQRALGEVAVTPGSDGRPPYRWNCQKSDKPPRRRDTPVPGACHG